MDEINELVDALKKEIEKLQARYELSKTVGSSYYEPGMMEYLNKSFGEYNDETGSFIIKFESRGTRYDGRTEQIEKVKEGEQIKIVREKDNEYNHNNFMIFTAKDKNVGNMPAELCNVIATLYDMGRLVITDAKVSYVEPISKRSRYAKQAVLFVVLEGSVQLYK